VIGWGRLRTPRAFSSHGPSAPRLGGNRSSGKVALPLVARSKRLETASTRARLGRHASAPSARVPTTATADESGRKPAPGTERLWIVLSVAERTLPTGTPIRACAPCERRRAANPARHPVGAASISAPAGGHGRPQPAAGAPPSSPRRPDRLAFYMGYCPHRRKGHVSCGTRDSRTLSRRRRFDRHACVVVANRRLASAGPDVSRGCRQQSRRRPKLGRSRSGESARLAPCFPRGAGGSAMLTTCAAWRERRSARSTGALFRELSAFARRRTRLSPGAGRSCHWSGARVRRDAAVTRASVEKRQRVDHDFAAEIGTASRPAGGQVGAGGSREFGGPYVLQGTRAGAGASGTVERVGERDRPGRRAGECPYPESDSAGWSGYAISEPTAGRRAGPRLGGACSCGPGRR
jgi:hypothetical protein